MSLRLRRLGDLPAAAFERCRKLDGIKSMRFFRRKTSKDDVTAFTSPMPKIDTTSSAHADASDHLLALLSIPAESDHIPTAKNIPGMSLQDDDVQHSANDKELLQPACSQSVHSQEEGQEGTTNSVGKRELAQMANEALAVAKARGLDFPWKEQPVNDEEKADSEVADTTGNAEDSTDLEKALSLLARLQAWDVFANADVEHQNRLLCFFGLPPLAGESEL
eukprot:TRINITY_DN24832_c1_g1_i1.p1 TRINITY_DN24832_c1_g1~~TRINITY_DN24832_c1_g1_i1.p1  ORF type:complete len:221 (+),score=45.44 TRINITY_DN24832_c1_g1_i1:56-718(+)